MIGRNLFVLCLGLTWLSSMMHIGMPGDMPYSRGPGEGKLHTQRLPAMFAATCLYVGAVSAWHQAYYEVASGAVILVILASIRQWEKSLWKGDVVVSLGKYVPTAACLLGYTVALALSSAPNPQEVGWEGAIGVMGGIFTINGFTKWHRGGLRWFGSQGLALLVAERSYSGRKYAQKARRMLVSSPTLCILLSAGTALLETGGFLLWVPAFRLPVGGAIGLVLLGFGLFLGYLEMEWLVLLLALMYSAG